MDIVPQTLNCSGCGQMLPTSDFSPKNSPRGYGSRCKQCMHEYRLEWRKNNDPTFRRPKGAPRKPIPSEKFCKRCEQTKPIADWRINQHSNGQQYAAVLCRQCESRTSSERAKAARVELRKTVPALKPYGKTPRLPKPPKPVVVKPIRVNPIRINLLIDWASRSKVCPRCRKAIPLSRYGKGNSICPPCWQNDKRNYEFRRLGNGGSHSQTEWDFLCIKHGNKCLCCGVEKPLTRDHVIPRSRGGSNDITNIQPLCFECNTAKKDNTTDYRK
jgi:5-methylcytosine-specific restriction endonuclease McrA